MNILQDLLSEAEIQPHKYKIEKLDKLVEIIKSKCKLALTSKNEIFRGSKSSKGSGIYNPSTGERASQNTSNNYTVLLDTNTLNKDWPKRSKSFICSTAKDSASSYVRSEGILYKIFPFDTTSLGVCNTSDFWHVDIKFNGDFKYSDKIIDFQEFWPHLFVTIGKSSSWIPTMPELIKELDSGSRADHKKIFDEFVSQSFNNEDDDPELVVKSFIEQLPKAFSYENMGCELHRPDFDRNEYHRNELWFSDECVMLTMKDYLKVKKILEK